MRDSTKTVSIITPAFNSQAYIENCIQSVLAQTIDSWELIVVDDASEDETQEIVRDYMRKDQRIKLIEQKINKGPAVARNLAIEAASGRYIAFLDSDDAWFSNKLERQIEFMETIKAPLAYTGYKKMNENGQIMSDGVRVPFQVTYNTLLNSCVIGCLTAIYDTSSIGKVYMPEIKKGQDYALWLKILKKGYVAHGLNEPLATYRVRRNSVSSNKLKAAKYQWMIYRTVEKLPVHRSIYHFMRYAYCGVKKYIA